MSVVMRSKDEADRLRLALSSLARQTLPPEVIVVERRLRPTIRPPCWPRRHARCRSPGDHACAGARPSRPPRTRARAPPSGDVLVFIDGDTLAGPGVCRAACAACMRKGRCRRVRCRRVRCASAAASASTSAAPASCATPRPARRNPARRRDSRECPAEERARLTVSRADVVGNFAAIERRAEPRHLSGQRPAPARRSRNRRAAAPSRLLDVLWVAASGSNLSVPREAFLRIGGFDEAIEKHRASRAFVPPPQGGGDDGVRRGRARLPPDASPAAGAIRCRSRAGRNCSTAAHPQLVVKLLAVFWVCRWDRATGFPRRRSISLPAGTLPRGARRQWHRLRCGAQDDRAGLPELPPSPPALERT